MTHNRTVMKRKQRVDIHKDQTKGASSRENFLPHPKHASRPSPKAGAPFWIAWIPTPAWQAALMPCAQVQRRKWSFWFACGYWRWAQTNIIRIDAKVTNWIEWGWNTVCKFRESPISVPVHAIWSFDEISVGFSSVLVLYHEMISIWNSSVWKLRFTAALLLFYSNSGIMLPLLWTDQSSGLVCLSTIIHTSSRSNLINCPGLLHICRQLQLYWRQLELDQLIKYIETLTGGSQLGFLKSLFSHLGCVLACSKTVSSNH